MNIRYSLGIAALLSLPTLGYSADLPSTTELLDTLRSPSVNLQYQHNAAIGHLLLRNTDGSTLQADQSDAAPLVRAQDFLSQFGRVFGLDNPVEQLSLQRISTDLAGNQHVHLDQMHAGLPVFGARLVVHMNAAGIRGTSGVFIPGLESLPTSPALTQEQLAAGAMQRAQKLHPDSELSLKAGQLMVYRSGLLEGYAGQNHLAYVATVTSTAGDVRERIILDANNGRLLNRINEIHSLKNREIYTPNQDVPAVITEGGLTAPADVPLSGDGPSAPTSRLPRPPTDNLYIFAGGTYDLYANLFGRQGYDDGDTPAEEQVQKSVYLINDQCPNAYWNGDSTNYCPGFDADDVVSHEWSHAYTEYTHGLIYQYQSGALNEAYSDIFGEVYDLVNGLEGPLGVTLTEGEYFENGGSRWVMGEDLGEAAAALLLRDMWDPDNFGINAHALGLQVFNFGSPGSVITSDNYYCGASDGGGVHTNSAVPNHAFAMLVDGKSFNGVDIPAIGMTRAAQIYFHAAAHYQVPTTNFPQHADALAQSCADLIGVPLNDVQGNPSPDLISTETCDAIEAAMTAVEMRLSPKEKCGYQPLLQPEENTPALCGEGEHAEISFFEDWESGSLPAGWSTAENISGDSSEGVEWTVVSDLPLDRPGHAAFLANTFGGSCAPGGDISASFMMDSPAIEVVEDNAVLSLDHLMQSEFSFDGGNLKFSLNDGAFAVVPAEAIQFNGFNTTLESAANGNTNPIAGEAAWSGSDEGESFSRWGTTLISLPALGAKPGDSLRLRFEFGQDGCNGNLGWFVDELTISHCVVDAEAQVEDSEERSLSAPRGGGLDTLLLLPLILLGWRRRRQ